MKKPGLSILFSFYVFTIAAQVCDQGIFGPPGIFDTYHEFFDQEESWASFNVHDPTVWKDGEWYYMYNTDVGLGYDAGSGALKRRSKDLVHWEFLGRAFEGVPQSARDFFLIHNPAYTDNGIWAPFLMKYHDEFRLYYSAPGGLEGQNLGFIGYATSASANGPWEEQGGIAGSVPGDTINAIDPSVIVDQSTGQHWMAYGSYQTGIYLVELDSTTGGLKTPGDRGVRIAGRSGGRHAAIEGPELAYRNGWYYLFVSYDWLEDFYNIRVGRSANPEGPYYDFNGVDMKEYSDNLPMIETPYRFNDHEGWQGTGHCSVYNDSGTYYMFNQARPSTSIFNMVLHARKIFWIDDWPVLSPERYAAVPECTITADSLIGEWERLQLIYNRSVPHSVSAPMVFSDDGTINNNMTDTWTLQDSLLTINWDDGATTDKLIVDRAWDWENECLTLIFTGMNDSGRCTWGKKTNQAASNRFNKLISGATYHIRNHYSNMYMEVPGGADADDISIRQGTEKQEAYQLWTIINVSDSYYKLVSLNSESGRVLEVSGGSDLNGADIRLGTDTGEDKQLFKILYNNTGYFRILTKVSSNTKCVDLAGFSIVPGGNIFQWDYLQGVNQMWRFKLVDTIDLVNSLKPTEIVDDPLQIYPNPFVGEIHIGQGDEIGINRVEVTNLLGVVLEQHIPKATDNGRITLNIRSAGKFFILRIHTNKGILVRTVVRE